MMPSADDLVAAARSKIAPVSVAEFDAERAAGALVIDIRPECQREEDGELDGAVVVDRNVLEWRLDIKSSHRLRQVSGYDQRIIIVCNEGYASSLAAAELHRIGLVNATDLSGGFQAWSAAHPEVESP